MTNSPMLPQKPDNSPSLGAIYLVSLDGEGYSRTNDRRMADAMISVGMYKQIGLEEFEQVKAAVDAKSGIPEIVQRIRLQNLRTGLCDLCGGKLFADGSCSNWECEASDV